MCELIEGRRPTGVVEILDEETIFPEATDATLLAKLQANLGNHKHFSTDTRQGTFTVSHYAGPVSESEYS